MKGKNEIKAEMDLVKIYLNFAIASVIGNLVAAWRNLYGAKTTIGIFIFLGLVIYFGTNDYIRRARSLDSIKSTEIESGGVLIRKNS